MANKSLLGGSFDPFVTNQLDIRSKLMEKDIYRNESNIFSLKYSSKNSFIKLSSGVNIDKETSNKIFNKYNYAGDNLAKNFVLQGGTLKNENSNFNLRGGFGETYILGKSLSDELTGFGLEDFGLRPMAGIESVQIKSIGKWGSLREATITIKAFNRAQYSVIETLYLRPGYTILLEWGHVPYFKNNDGNAEVVDFVNTIDFFKKGITRKSIYREILKKQEESEGNYDAFIGPVINFNSVTNADGSYTFTVKAISWGAVIESLKINASGGVPPSIKIVTYSINKEKKEIDPDNFKNVIGSKSKFSAILNEFLRFKKVRGLKVGGSEVIDMNSDEYKQLLNSFDQDESGHSINNPPYSNVLYVNGIEAVAIKNKFDFSSFGPNNPSINVPKPTSSSPQNKLFPFDKLVIVNFFNQETQTKLNSANVYMPLGGLLSLISKNIILRNEDDKIINIDFNINENICFSPKHHLSIDPEVCLIKYEEKDFSPYSINKEPIIISDVFNDNLPKFKTGLENIPNTGYTMNIMVNVEKVLDILNKYEEESSTGDVYLHEFLTELMNNISEALGGINSFNVGVDEATNTLTIRDNQLLIPKDQKSITIINTTGLKSSIRDMNITSQISNRLSSMITIGAQARNEAIGIDASALSSYNEGLTDRIFSRRLLDDTNPNQSQADKIYKAINNNISSFPAYNDLYITIKGIYGGLPTVISDAINNAKTLYKDILIQNKANSREGLTRGLNTIPFTFNLKMDGISGIKFGQVFSIESSRLPKHWVDKKTNLPELAFLVTSINHDIGNNIWLTTIGGQAMPYRNEVFSGEPLNGLTPDEKDIMMKIQWLEAYVTGVKVIESILNLKDRYSPSPDKPLFYGLTNIYNPRLSVVSQNRLLLLFGYTSVSEVKSNPLSSIGINNLPQSSFTQINNSVKDNYEVNGITIQPTLSYLPKYEMGDYGSSFNNEFTNLLSNLEVSTKPKNYNFSFPPNLEKRVVDIFNLSEGRNTDGLFIREIIMNNAGLKGEPLYEPYQINIK